MKLYGSYTSPFVRHCRVAFAQEGITFDFVDADYAMSAEKSPVAKVPFLVDGDLMLTDSSSIVKYARERGGNSFLAGLDDCENFAMVSTVADSAINIFLLQNDGVTAEQSGYLKRQQNRINGGLAKLDARFAGGECDLRHDGTLRCVCFLAWGLFRNRISLDGLPNLQALLDSANRVPEFAATAPPQ